MDPNNPVVKLCAAGMKAESEGKADEARAFFLQAWDARANSFDGCLAAHYVARHQTTPEDGLHWNQQALDLADQVSGEVVRGFYASLYLNLGFSHETLGTRTEARRYYDLAAAHLVDVPEGPYGDIVRGGIKAALSRTD